MNGMDTNNGCLVLENGMVFHGVRFGSEEAVTAEIVFATGMNGYLETLTDPSYYGQAVVQTFPLIGNYGLIPEDFESRKAFLSAYITSEICEDPSNFRCQGRLGDWLSAQKIPVLCGIDTRTLTRVLRDHGTMNGVICGSPEEADFDRIRAYRVTDAVKNTTCEKPYTLGEACCAAGFRRKSKYCKITGAARLPCDRAACIHKMRGNCCAETGRHYALQRCGRPRR